MLKKRTYLFFSALIFISFSIYKRVGFNRRLLFYISIKSARVLKWKRSYSMLLWEGGDGVLLSGKINKIRTFALLLIFIGIGIMYFGFVWPQWMAIFFILGLVATFASVGIYFWIGILSTHSVKVICPECERETKVLGKRDQCMYCQAILSVDPKDAPQ